MDPSLGSKDCADGKLGAWVEIGLTNGVYDTRKRARGSLKLS